jgi:hypothetical protein
MRLRSIWTMPRVGMSYKEKLVRSRDELAQQIAIRLPSRVKYWCTMQCMSMATRNCPDVMDARLAYIIDHLDTPKELRA